MSSQIWGAHPFVWALACVAVAIIATVLALTVLRDPRVPARRAFLRQCHEQAFDRGTPDRCTQEARARYGAFGGLAQNLAYLVAAIAVAAGTFFVVLYVVRQVGRTVRLRG